MFRFAVVCTELSFQDETIERHGGKKVPSLNQKAFLCEFACSHVFPMAALVSLTIQKNMQYRLFGQNKLPLGVSVC